MLQDVYLLYSRHSPDSLNIVDQLREDAALNFVHTVRVDSKNAREFLSTTPVSTVPSICVRYSDGKVVFFQGGKAFEWISNTSRSINEKRSEEKKVLVKPHPPPEKESMSLPPKNTKKPDNNVRNGLIEKSDHNVEQNSSIKPNKKNTASLLQKAKEMESGRDGNDDKPPTAIELQEQINGSGYRADTEDEVDINIEMMTGSNLLMGGDGNSGDGSTTSILDI